MPDDMPMTIVQKLEEQLSFRLPHSRKPLGAVLLSRADAEELLKLIYRLRQEAEAGSMNDIIIRRMKWCVFGMSIAVAQCVAIVITLIR